MYLTRDQTDSSDLAEETVFKTETQTTVFIM
jgi:hypothetical protein